MAGLRPGLTRLEGKAPEDRRTPKRWRAVPCARTREASWSAVVLYRFWIGASCGSSISRLYAILTHELFVVSQRRRKPRGGNGLALSLLVCQVQIELEEEGGGVFDFLHALRGADGGVEGGAGVAEAVGAGGFEGAIEFAQGPAIGGRDVGVGAPKSVNSEHPTLARHLLDSSRKAGVDCWRGWLDKAALSVRVRPISSGW